MPGRKSEVEEAKWIATLLDKQLLKGSLVPEKTIRILRLYLRQYCQLQGCMTRCLQEIEKHFSQCNIKIGSLTSTLDSVTVLSILEIITKGQDEAELLMQFVHGRVTCRHGKEKVLRSLQGIIEDHDVFIFKQIYEDYNQIQNNVTNFWKQRKNLLQSIMKNN